MKKTLLVLPFLIASIAHANMAAQSFGYRGNIKRSNGDSFTENVSVVFQILAPNGCLLYEEQQTNIDLSKTKGTLLTKFGSVKGAPARTANDPQISMDDIFTNGKSFASGANCQGGYVSADGDIRKLHVKIIKDSGNVDLSPDIPMVATGNALTADTIQGKIPSDFIQTSGSLSQDNAQKLVSNQDVGSLHTHESLYVRKGGTPTFSKLTITQVGTSSTSLVNKDYVANQVSTLGSGVVELQNNVIALNGAVVQNAGTITSIQNKIGTLTAPIGTLTTATTALNTTVTANSSALHSVQQTADSNDAGIAALKLPHPVAVLPPAGFIIFYAGTTCPSGYLNTDGSSYSATTYFQLAAALTSGSNYVWGGTVASGNFNVPDLRGVFLRGVDAVGARDPDYASRYNSVGVVGGVVGSYEGDQLRNHNHVVTTPGTRFGKNGANPWGFFGGSGDVGDYGPRSLTSDGGTNGSETRPQNAAVLMCIKQ